MQGLSDFDDASTMNESKSGFWGVLARKAKAILEDDVASQSQSQSQGYGTAAKTFSYSNASPTDQVNVSSFLLKWSS